MRQTLFVVALVLCASSLFAAGGADALAAGKLAMRNDEPDKAAELFEKAVAAEPNNATYHLWLGNAYGQMTQKASMFKQLGLAKKTKSAFERAVELDPNLLDARFALVDYYIFAPGIAGGSEEKAKQQADEIKKRDALAGHRAYARIYKNQKKNDLALREMITSVREQPTSAKAHHYYAVYLFGEKNYKGAAEEFEAAVKLDPAYMPAYFRIGVTAARAGNNYARGEETLKKYLAYTPTDQEPSHASAWYYLGQLYEKQNRKPEAKQAYLNAQKLAPKSKEIAEALKRV
ncbi:MAG TPA: tetratricopeptide repeat protein [Thermoanaerobaculia bacterium]|nr:tetratricopeptide repeat protein [Thermoanaerobaculia bacterium]